MRLRSVFPVLLLFALVLAAALALALSGPGSERTFAQDDSTETPEPPDPTSDDPVERGRYLARVAFTCVGCHGDETHTENALGAAMSGGGAYDGPWGTVYAANLTQLGDWTDEQIETAIRAGIDNEGRVLFPPMSYELYHSMTDDDMAALIAYLRTLEPVENEVPAPELAEGVESAEMFRTPPEIDPDAEFPVPDDFDDPVVYGHYLAKMASCLHCHGTVNEFGVPDPDGLPVGFIGPSLMPDQLGEWTDEELFTLLREGVNPRQDNRPVQIMPTYSYKYLSDDDINALIAWMRSLPADAE